MICLRWGDVSLRIAFSFLIVIALLCTCGQDAVVLASMGAAFLHECAHLVVMAGVKQPIASITFYGCGIRIVPEHVLCDYRKELGILLAGPAINLLVGGVLYGVGRRELFASANLALGILNLLPCRQLDGGAILRCLLGMSRWGDCLWEKTATVIACGTLLGLVVAAIFLRIENISCYAVCIYLFFAEIFQ